MWLIKPVQKVASDLIKTRRCKHCIWLSTQLLRELSLATKRGFYVGCVLFPNTALEKAAFVDQSRLYRDLRLICSNAALKELGLGFSEWNFERVALSFVQNMALKELCLIKRGSKRVASGCCSECNSWKPSLLELMIDL